MPNPADPVDAIAAALARLRGRRGGRPWERGPHGGEPHGHHPHHDEHAANGRHGEHGRGHPGGGRGAHLAGPARLRLLDALDAASTPLSVGEIADVVGVDQPRASRLVQQCVEMGLVRREADPEDARRTRVALTEQGAAFARNVRGERRTAVRTALQGLTDAEQAEFARLLAKFADNWPG
jgi:DNA-binding MarR family transcriptional regulator